MKYKVGKSQIHGDGVFAIKSYKKGERISTEPDYVNDTNQTIASSFHNHNDKDSNILNVKKGNKRFLIAKRGIEVGEELTANYNLTPSPPYEDPNNFKDLDERELPLSDEEAQAMIDGGFVLEEMHKGGEPGHTHDPPSYEDAMQAYKDSIAAKEAYEEEYKKKEKDYSKLKAKYDKYNKTYLNNKKMWGLIDSIDPESNPYVDIDTFPSFNQGPNAYKLYQNLPSDIKEQLDFPEFDKRDIGQRFNTSVLPEGVTADSDYYSEGAGASGLIDLNHLHRSDLSFRYPKDNPKYKPDLSHLAYPTTTNWNHNFSTPDLKENFPIASVYDIHSDRFKNITDKDVKVINFYADRNSDLDFYNREILKLLQDSGLDLTGMTTNASQSEQQIINRLIKLQEPDKIGSLEYNPPEVLERPNFADYVDPMPVIKPELIVDTSLPEELIERDEVEGVDYERKFGMWLDDKAQKDAKLKTFFKYKVPEFFNDKPSRTSQYYRTPKKIRSGFYNKPIEEEQLYPEGFAPRFHEGGTPHSHLHDPLLEEQDGGPVVKQRRGEPPINYSGPRNYNYLLDEVYSKYPRLKIMKDNLEILGDTSYTREATGIGDIEFFGPDADEYTYPTNLTYPNPNPGGYGIPFNPKTTDAQGIALDMLHGMDEADPKYANLKKDFSKAYLNSKFKKDFEEEVKWVKKEVGEDKYNEWYDSDDMFFDHSYIDGIVRNLLFEGTPEDFKKSRYWDKAQEVYLSDPKIKKAFFKLKDHLTSEPITPNKYIEAELSDEDVERYRAGGYVLEELVDGGEDDIVRPHGDSYEYKTVNGKYYTRKRESEWKNGEQLGWNLATGNAAEAIKYNIFKEERPKTKTAYDPNDSSNFDSRYNNEFKLDQGIDNTANNYYQVPTLNLNGTDPDAEYNAYVAAKPQHKRVPSWMDKNVFEPIGDLYDKFQNTSFGPVDDAVNFVNDAFVQPIVTLATDTYNDPNKVAGETIQMMMDGVQAPSKILAEDIYTSIINPEAEFDWNNIGSEKSLQRAGEIAAVLPMVPSILGAGSKTAKVVNKLPNVKLPHVKLPYPKMDLNKLGSYPISKEALPTTVKGSKEYIKNFKPKKTLQLENIDMKFDRVLADIKAKDSPFLTRNLNAAEFDKNLLGLKNENRVLGPIDEIYGRRTKHFSGTGQGAAQGSGDYNTTFIGNIDDIKKASGSHLREVSPTDTYFYNPDNIFKLTNEGVYLTSDPATYERLYNAGKTVKFKPSMFDNADFTGNSANLEKFLPGNKDVLKSFDDYLIDPNNRGTLTISSYPNKTTAFPSSMNSSAAHSYDILGDLESLERLPINGDFIRRNLIGRSYISPNLTKATEAVNEFGSDFSYFTQWINLPKKIRASELKKLKDFYKSNVKTGKITEDGLGYKYVDNLEQYKVDYKKIIDHLEALHKSAGLGLKYKKGGFIEVELSDKEVAKYKAGGYILEELHEPELPKANGGGKFLANKVAPVVIEPAIKLKLKRGGLVRFDNGGGIDSKLKVTNTFDKEKVDELRTRHEKFENENSDVKKVSFEEWLNYQLMDQRSNDNPDAKRKFTDYMVINEDGSASVYDGEELKNRMWQHGRKMEQLVGAGLPEGDHLFLQEHITKATADGEIRYMNHIKKGLREGMTMTEIKNDMLKNKLISKKGWNKKYEGKTVDHINTEYEKVQGTIKEFDNKFKVMQTNLGSKIDPDLMDIKQLQMDPQSAYDYVKQEPEPEVKYQRIAGTAHTQQIPSMEGVSIPNLANESTVSSGEALYNKTMNPAGLPLTAASKNWQSLKENEKQNWNVKSTFADINNKSAAYKKTANEYVGNAANQMYNQNIQSDFDNNQLDPNGRYIGEGNPPFVFAGGADEIDPLDYVPWTEKEIANNELNNKTQLLNSMYNRDFTNEDFVSQVTQKFSPENYVTTGKDDFGREILKKADYNSNSTIGAQRRAQDAITNSGYNSTMQHSGRTGWVDPVKWIMGPGAGVAGLGKNLVTKSLKGLSNSLRTSPVNWASKNLLGKELPGWLNYATTPGKIIGADFAYNSFKPDGLVPNLAEGIQKVYQGNDDGKKQIVDNAFGALWGVPAFKGIRGAQNLIKNIKGTNSLMPAAKNSRFGNYGFGYTSPSGNTNILRANPDYTVGDKIKNFKPSFDINMPGIGRFQGAKYTEPTATGYSRATKDPFGFSKNFSLNTSGTPSTSTSGSKFSNNNYLLGNSKLNNSFNSFSDTNPDGWKPTDTDPDFQSTFNKSVANTERQKIADINNVIVDQTKQEVSDLSSPEGIRRLTLNYKNLNPNLNEEELNHLVTTTINEVNEAGTQNVASYLAEDASFENMGAGEAISEIDKAIPKGNAYFTGNPFYGDKLRGDVPSRQKGFGLDAFKRFGSDESEILGNLGESMKSGNIPTVGTSWGKPIKRLDLWSGALSSQNPIFTPGSITTGSDLADNPTIGHELGHAIARSGVTDTDIKLQQLFTDAGVKGFGQRNWNKKVIKNNPDSAETLEAGQNYFYNPGYGNQAMSPTNKKYYDMPIEGFPMAREFRQDMIDKGLLQSKYDKITPSILESYGLSNTPTLENRAFYMSPPSKYGPFSDILNDMPSWLAPTIGTGVGVGIGLNSQKEEKDVKLKKGGFIDLKLTEKEALAYARNGYVLEVIN